VIGQSEKLPKGRNTVLGRVNPAPYGAEALSMSGKEQRLCGGRTVLNPETFVFLQSLVAANDNRHLGILRHLRILVLLTYLFEHVAIADHYEMPRLFVSGRGRSQVSIASSGTADSVYFRMLRRVLIASSVSKVASFQPQV